MKYMIASDLHGSAYYCEKMWEAYEREEADRLIFLGDILYHGPRNDLPVQYEPKKVIAMMNARKEEILAVRGNCEAEVDQMVLQFPVMAEYALMTVRRSSGNTTGNNGKNIAQTVGTDGNNGENIARTAGDSGMSPVRNLHASERSSEKESLIFITHGHLFNEEHLPMLKDGDILLHGHTHVPVCREHEHYVYMNPGSLSLPKENSWHGYMTLEDGLFLWKEVESGQEQMRYQV